MTIQKNVLHYYVDLLRMKDGEERTPEQSVSCVTTLHNVIRTMQLSRHDKVCGEDFSRLDFGNIPFNGINWSLNGKFPSCFNGCKLNEWNFMSGHFGAVDSIAWSPDGKQFLSGSDDRTVILWDAESGMMINRLQSKEEDIVGVAFTEKGKYCLTSSKEDSIYVVKVWDFDTGEYLRSFREMHDHVRSTVISPDGKYCVINFSKRAPEVYDFETVDYIKSLEGNIHRVFSVKMLYEGKYYYSQFDTQNDIEICDLETDKCIRSLHLNYGFVQSADVSSNGKYCLIDYLRGKKNPEIWNLETKECVKKLAGRCRVSCAAAFSPDDRKCLIGSDDHSIKTWEVDTGKCLHSSDGFFNECRSAVLSPNGKYCLMDFEDDTLKLWNCRVRKHICTFTFDDYLILIFTTSSDFAITSDGKFIAVKVILGNNVILIDCRTGQCLPFKPKIFPIKFIDFSADGKYVILTSEDDSKEIRNRETGEYLQTVSASQKLPDNIKLCRHIVNTKKRDNVCDVYFSDDYSEPILSVYNVNGMYIQNCHFHNVTAEETTRKILYQYGGITDPDDENKS